MFSYFDKWRFYKLGREDYKRCMEKSFTDNLYSLFKANVIVVITATLFSFFPILVVKDIFKAVVQLSCSIAAVIQCFYIKHKINQHEKAIKISDKLVCALIILYYLNVMTFAVYLGVFANPGRLAVTFMCILICALFLFNLSPVLYLILTVGALSVFIAATVSRKLPNEYTFDVVNSMFAGCVSLFFGWHAIMQRMLHVSSANKMEVERDSYYNQSTIDELTQLKNRRDFSLSFKRFLFNYRQSDSYLCVAILDIDFFKNYNDYYGHSRGDECLRMIGKTLNALESAGVYAARIGGEEFAMIWFENEIANAEKIALKVNQTVRDLNIPHAKSSVAQYVTISTGVHIVKCGTYSDIQPLFDLADKAMYSAKSAGRDGVVITSDFS